MSTVTCGGEKGESAVRIVPLSRANCAYGSPETSLKPKSMFEIVTAYVVAKFIFGEYGVLSPYVVDAIC